LAELLSWVGAKPLDDSAAAGRPVSSGLRSNPAWSGECWLDAAVMAPVVLLANASGGNASAAAAHAAPNTMISSIQ
jgi:hypothetical protein